MPPSASVALPPIQFKVNRWIWFAIWPALALDALLLRRMGFTVDFSAAHSFFFIIAACAAIGFGARYWKRDDVLCLFGNAINQIVFIAFAAGIFSYLGAAFSLPLRDDALIAADRFLGFDWRDYIGWVNAHPSFAQAFTLAYDSFNVQIILFVCLPFIYKKPAQAQCFVIAFYIAAILCTVLSAMFPAMGGYVHYDIDLHHFPHLHPAAARVHEAAMLALRGHSMTVISFPMQGLVTFPSFHSAVAVLLIYASLPFQRLRLLAIPFNVAMLFSTPVDGGHYLVDVLAGVAIALCGIWIARRVLPAPSLK